MLSIIEGEMGQPEYIWDKSKWDVLYISKEKFWQPTANKWITKKKRKGDVVGGNVAI